MARVIIFGLDAASPTLIRRWRQDLPTIDHLIREGVWGVLDSVTPPFTSPAWSCMATGKNPGKIGIFGLRHRQPTSYRFVAPTSAMRKTPALWELAGDAGKRVLVVNVPDTYPPSAVNGALISGRPAPINPGADITYPSTLRGELEHALGPYLVSPSADYDDDSREEELSAWIQVMESQQRVLEHLLMQQDWDLLFYVSMAVDAISHHHWKYIDPQHPQFDPAVAPQFDGQLRQIYQQEDQRLNRIRQSMAADDILLVVSDHGSAPCYRHIAVNLWLIEQGYLVLKEDSTDRSNTLLSPFIRHIMQLYRRSATIRRLAQPFKRGALRDAVVTTQFRRRSGGRIPFDALAIDWHRTRAYYLGDNRLYINLAGREPHGVIQPGRDYENLRAELISKLLLSTEPESGEPLYAAVLRSDEIYHGPYLDQAPDLILVPGHEHWNLGGAIGEHVVDRPVISGKHHPQGVFIAWGSTVQQGREATASLYDIAPTVLHILNLPIPTDSDGAVRRDWFYPDSELATRPIKTMETHERMTSAYELNEEEEAQIETQLRNLGYLD